MPLFLESIQIKDHLYCSEVIVLPLIVWASVSVCLGDAIYANHLMYRYCPVAILEVEYPFQIPAKYGVVSNCQ